MSVTRGHKLITVLPTNADEETAHGRVYLHANEPYDHTYFREQRTISMYKPTQRKHTNSLYLAFVFRVQVCPSPKSRTTER